MPPTAPIDILNPLKYTSERAYSSFWENAFNTVLHGFWSRFIFMLLIALAFWIGVRQRNPTLALVCLTMAALVAYVGGVMDWLKTL